MSHHEVMHAPAPWSCACVRRPFRPQINRHGQPRNKDGTDTNEAERAHEAFNRHEDSPRYLRLRERREYRRTGVGSCLSGRFCAKILNLHALHSRPSFGVLRCLSGKYHAHVTQDEFPRATSVVVWARAVALGGCALLAVFCLAEGGLPRTFFFY